MRHLRAIEIAEGALLADIAVVFQLIAAAFPIGGSLFRILTYVIFAVLVLRRGTYVAGMAFGVAFVLVGIVSGPTYLPSLVIQGGGGIFMAFMMARRRSHLLTILLWVCAGSFYIYVLNFLVTFLAGLHIGDMISSLHDDYNTVLAAVDFFFARLGLANWWRREMHPFVTSMSNLAFTYWWITSYLLLCVLMFPPVAMIYAVINTSVRFLGYDVRPFPNGWVIPRLRREIRFWHKWRMRERLKEKKDAASYKQNTTY